MSIRLETKTPAKRIGNNSAHLELASFENMLNSERDGLRRYAARRLPRYLRDEADIPCTIVELDFRDEVRNGTCKYSAVREPEKVLGLMQRRIAWRCNDMIRKADRRNRFSQSPPSTLDAVSDRRQDAREAVDVQDECSFLLGLLSEESKKALLDREYGQSFHERAKETGVSRSTAYRQHSHAMSLVQRRYRGSTPTELREWLLSQAAIFEFDNKLWFDFSDEDVRTHLFRETMRYVPELEQAGSYAILPARAGPLVGWVKWPALLSQWTGVQLVDNLRHVQDVSALIIAAPLTLCGMELQSLAKRLREQQPHLRIETLFLLNTMCTRERVAVARKLNIQVRAVLPWLPEQPFSYNPTSLSRNDAYWQDVWDAYSKTPRSQWGELQKVFARRSLVEAVQDVIMDRAAAGELTAELLDELLDEFLAIACPSDDQSSRS